jgi:hypothetical protein
MDSQTFSFLEPWRALSAEQAESLLREAQAEISPSHPMYGANLVPMAHSRLADDVLFKLDDGRVAVLHLTWRRSPEPPPWPSCRIYANIDEWAGQVMIPDNELE